MAQKKPHSHVLEYIIGFLMIAFGIAVAWIFVTAFKSDMTSEPQLAIIELLLIVVLIILAQTVVLIRIYDQH